MAQPVARVAQPVSRMAHPVARVAQQVLRPTLQRGTGSRVGQVGRVPQQVGRVSQQVGRVSQQAGRGFKTPVAQRGVVPFSPLRSNVPRTQVMRRPALRAGRTALRAAGAAGAALRAGVRPQAGAAYRAVEVYQPDNQAAYYQPPQPRLVTRGQLASRNGTRAAFRDQRGGQAYPIPRVSFQQGYTQQNSYQETYQNYEEVEEEEELFDDISNDADYQGYIDTSYSLQQQVPPD